MGKFFQSYLLNLYELSLHKNKEVCLNIILFKLHVHDENGYNKYFNVVSSYLVYLRKKCFIHINDNQVSSWITLFCMYNVSILNLDFNVKAN